MNRIAALAAAEARLLVRDWTVLVFAFVFPPFVMLILAGVFGNQPNEGYGMQRPDDYYVAASIGVPVIALALVGLPVALASYRERGVLRRFEAFGISTAKVVAAQAIITCGLVVLGAAIVLAVAAPTYGIPHVVHPWQTVLGLAAGTLTLVLLGVAIGLAAPTARAAQAIGLLAFFPLYLLGGGGPPKGAMTDTSNRSPTRSHRRYPRSATHGSASRTSARSSPCSPRGRPWPWSRPAGSPAAPSPDEPTNEGERGRPGSDSQSAPSTGCHTAPRDERAPPLWRPRRLLGTSTRRPLARKRPPPRSCIRGKQQSRSRFRVPCI
jgi:ABC-2 type transport system permease protein